MLCQAVSLIYMPGPFHVLLPLATNQEPSCI